MQVTVAEVLINRPSKHLNRTFSYRVPDSLREADVGYRCVVSFARRLEEGIILSLRQEDTEHISYKLLEIHSLVDPFPWFTPEMLELAKHISSYYMCTLIEALRLFFIDKKGIQTDVEYEISWDTIPMDEEIRGLIDTSVETISEKDAKLLMGDALGDAVKKGFLLRRERPSAVHKIPLEKWLTPLQEPSASTRRKSPKQAAISYISQSIDRNQFEGILLKGVTGSGKTEVYLQSALKAIEHGGSALILVPEIALTSQMTSYFAALLGEKVVFLHSNLSKGERYNNRQRIANGESNIIIGSRSSIFMPFHELKLIVVDEEYDTSYKQGESPRYNGRDVAKMMAQIHHCPIVLGAATPSIATYYAAKAHKIALLEMKERVFHTPLPAIHIYDMKAEQGPVVFSHPLVELLQKTLEEKNKSILLLNRRGFATTLLCSTCGHVFKCDHCDVSLVYHKDTQQLKCHYCETVHPLPTECPKCHGRHILYLGWGTQRIEDMLAEAIPAARCQRFDVDSTQKKGSAKHILDRFKKGDFDILFGTQMVAKGHDIPGVQTVGILSADGSLNMPSYLAAEQTFNLITQCAGRAGRSHEQGEVLLQTYNPDHYVIQTAARQDYESFYHQEIQYRKLLQYPPFTKMMKITCFHEEERKAKALAEEIYQWLRQVNGQLKQPVYFTPPYDEPIKRVRNMYYISILIKGASLLYLKSAMRQAAVFAKNDIIIDVDPM